ncbi:HypA protein [Coniella lustricola]|uniref:HypA protein n=1 Tax=Coniella lustricola TaxID=2025994 RepID=A0A2T3AJN4_9PEZI|nr:HypA protein [Coniella lustricola]
MKRVLKTNNLGLIKSTCSKQGFEPKHTTALLNTRRSITMATTRKIYIDANNTGLWKVKQTDESAKKASELLQHDLETHHVYFNEKGFHNHLVHHVLSLYGTGAPSSVLQAGYDNNASYQRARQPLHNDVVTNLIQDWSHAKAYLGKGEHYPDFLAFFQREIDAKGWEGVLSEYVFAGTEAADDMLVRLYAGFLHPLIQLLYGMEWKQPAIVAEALAQTCVHEPNFKEVLLESEEKASKTYGRTTSGHGPAGADGMPRIMKLIDEVRNDEKLRGAARMDDDNKIRDGVLARAPEEMLRVISKVKIRPEELDERTAEMFDASLYVAAAASFRFENKFNFFLMHHVNSSPIFLTFNAQPWIPVETKVRLLEWKIRYDLIQYAARGAPVLDMNEIKSYKPKDSKNTSVAGKSKPFKRPCQDLERLLGCLDVLTRLYHFEADDGHAIKLARAAVIQEALSKEYEDRDWLLLKGDDVWTKIHHMIVDSVEAPGEAWSRTVASDDTWTKTQIS